LDNAINKIAVPRLIQKEQFPTLQHCSRIESIPAQKEFLSKLLNEYLEEAYNSEEFVQSRYEFAKSGGKIFKEQIQERWDGSEFQMYINTLLKNLNEHSPFEIQSTDNLTLKSFAAFCQKGESDIDRLEDYLISNGIGDFRIAFALWGIVFGFANMPKTLTNSLFLSDDLDYISEVYKYIFKQVHSIELEGMLENGVEEVPSKPNKPISGQPPKDTPEGTNVPADTEELQIRGKLKKEKIKESQIESIIEAWRNNHFLINEKLFTSILDIRGIGVKTLEKIRIYLHQQNIIQTEPAPTLFQNDNIKPEEEFYKDANVMSFLVSIVPRDNQKKVKTEIDWIQKVHRDGGYSKKSGERIELKDHSNSAVINHLQNNSKKKIEETLLAKIISELKSLYW
jgi:hypothetical protein